MIITSNLSIKIKEQVHYCVQSRKIMKHYLYGILSFFKHHITNAIAEGINLKITTVQKMAYSYRNRENLKTVTYFHCGNLDMRF